MARFMKRIAAAVVIFVAVVPGVQAQDEKVIRSLTPEAAEKLLLSMKIEYKKSSSKKGEEHYFDFQRTKFNVRLTLSSPKDLMLDCVFRGIPLEQVNQWNTFTRLCRASLHKEGAGTMTLLEYGLDLSGGVTEGAIKQCILRFDEELKSYDKFLDQKAVDNTILKTVTNDNLEHILKTLGVTYQKKLNAAGVMMFDFQLNKQRLRLYNFGGADLMMDAHFRKISLEEANRYNLNKKFIRVVNYKAKDVEYTALEINLDCEAGVTEGMIRNWILSYGDDARDFAEYTKKMQPEEKK